jgi:hypothetical protein
MMVPATRELKGKSPSHSGVTNTLSRTQRTGEICLLVHVYLAPVRRISRSASEAMQSLNLWTRG